MRSPENIVKEIEMLIREYGVREITFVDDTFTLEPDRIYDIFALARSKGLKFKWSCMSRINTVDERLLRFMRDNGCWYIAFGIESGDEGILKVIRKRIRLDDVTHVIQFCHDIGIVTKGFFMVGHPQETLKTVDKTIRFAKDLKLDQIVVTINTPMPGTYQYEHAEEYGTIDKSSWDMFNYWNPVFEPYNIDRKTLVAKHKEFIRSFYLRPRVLWKNLKILLSNPQVAKELKWIVSTVMDKKGRNGRQHLAG